MSLLFIVSTSISNNSAIFSIDTFLSSSFPGIMPTDVATPFPASILPSRSNISPLSAFDVVTLILSSLSKSGKIKLSCHTNLYPCFVFFSSAILSNCIVPAIVLHDVSYESVTVSAFFSFTAI